VAIADFVHLKVRSAYSLTEGANKVDKVVSLAKEQAMPAVAITDRSNLFGALEFAQYASKAGIQPIIGCDLAIRREEESGVGSASKIVLVDWLTLLVQSEAGYLNLMRLVSRAHLEFKAGSVAALPMIDLEISPLLRSKGGDQLKRLELFALPFEDGGIGVVIVGAASGSDACGGKERATGDHELLVLVNCVNQVLADFQPAIKASNEQGGRILPHLRDSPGTQGLVTLSPVVTEKISASLETT